MRTFKITDPKKGPEVMQAAWESAKGFLAGGPVEIQLKRPSKSREQEEKYHAMIGDIAATVELPGPDGSMRKYSRPVWKAKLVHGFEQELRANGQTLRHPSQVTLGLDGVSLVTIRASTTDFTVAEGSQFIEYLYCFGAEAGARFSEKSLAIYQEYREAQEA